MVEPVAWISPTGRLGSTHFTRLSPFHYTGRVGVVKKLPSKTPHGLEPKWPTMVSPQVTHQPLWQYHCSTQKFHYVTFCFKTRQVAMPSRCQSCDALLTDGGTCGLNLAHRSAGFDSFRSPFSTPLYWLGGCGPENHLQLNEGRSHHLALSQNGSQWFSSQTTHRPLWQHHCSTQNSTLSHVVSKQIKSPCQQTRCRLGSTNFTRLSPLHYTGRVGDHGERGQKFTLNLMRGAHITWP